MNREQTRHPLMSHTAHPEERVELADVLQNHHVEHHAAARSMTLVDSDPALSPRHQYYNYLSPVWRP